ncbi:isopeptide-forming domain-containing fimbrial protein [Nitratireductor rhodophyticola]|uniref:isopeptide-forming domain-containing fimbrial protein n=1 Tax=Nitratireductor rhodophyticola TaxID=2854036 RepID=UPI002AC95F19|nr:isopeptide-forming domain-containing fimbrial protein [Nitratireductor rhodophyticola]WPZ12961.1 isopeptide-forming domain-containing fimbrial protein [Nitratireductor rhodophyticola]
MLTVGVNEGNATHRWRGWFCSNTANSAASGVHRQAGGRGYDGINVYCGQLEQSRHSAFLMFADFAWDQTVGGAGWLVNLTKDDVLLDNGNGQTGENVDPYISATANDPAVYNPPSELYVLPGTGYGATTSQRPAGIPENSFAQTGSCVDNVTRADQEDGSCSLTIAGRPDLSIAISTPTGVYNAPGDTMNMTVSATNLGPGTVEASDGFAISIAVPTGWTASPVPGCTVSGQTVSCAVNTSLAPAAVPGGAGGDITFTIPLVANSEAVSGSHPLIASLDRTASDGDGDPTNDDFDTTNDQAQGTIEFVKLPRLTVRKATFDDVGSFTFTGNNGWQSQTITTVSEGVAERGDTQILSEVGVETVISETLPPNWVLDDVICLGIGSGGTVSFDDNSFTLSSEAVAVDSEIDCTVVNQKVLLSTSKASDVGDGVGVQAGDTITYTLTSVVTGGTTTQDLVLTDVLGTGLDFGSVTAAGAFVADTGGAPALSFTLPAGTAAGTYSVSYTATVSDSAPGSVSNAVTADVGDCSLCATSNPLVELSTSKASDVGDRVGVQAGDTITYTLTSVVTGGTTTQDLVLTDVLGAGLDFGSVTAPGVFVADTGGAPTLSFTLPAGTSAGTYSVSYTATVSDSASGSVSNAAEADVGDCNPCATANPLVELSTSKASDVGSGVGVQAGDTITYTLTSVVTGGTTTQDLVLTDVLGTGLDFGSVTAPGAFVADTGGAPTLSFTLPAGTVAGTYSVSYTATVSDSASGSVSNAVTADVGDCNPCATSNPLVELSTSKASDVGDGVGVQAGDTITYTLTSVVTGGTMTQDLVLTDVLGAGLDFGSVTAAGAFVADTGGAPALSFTLPAGTAAGTYSVSYTATVSGRASGSVSNVVTADVGGCSPCATANPLVELSTSKASDVGNGVGVQTGDTITYTLTSVVTGGTTTQDLVLTDVLGTGLDFGSVTAAGAFVADTGGAPTLSFTLPAGTSAGTYSVSYTATVSDSASGSVSNAAEADVGDCNPCATANPLVELSTSKASDVGNGVGVQTGDTITYTLTSVVTGGTTTQDLVLSDVLGAGLDFGSVTAAGAFVADTGGAPTLSFTLPAGTAAGTHSVSYTATVSDGASGPVSNAVTADVGDCSLCATSNPLVELSTSKASDVGNGVGVQAGDMITYTLTSVVTGGTTTQDLVLSDVLGAGLDFGSVTAPGAFVADTGGAPTLSFTLPAGTAAGTYSVSYTATVSDGASGSVSNAVTADVGNCSLCATSNPLVELSTSKASDVGNGVGVQAGDTITYTLTSVVTGGTTTQDLVLSDVLGAGLDFGSVTAPGAFVADTGGAPTLSFTLPAGTSAGTYSVSYTATVSDSASGSVSNAAEADVGDCNPCATANPLVELSTSKASDVGSGVGVQAGDTITYTLTSVVTGGTTTQDLVLTDVLGTGLDFGSVTAPGAFVADTGGAPTLSFTLPAGTVAGTYSVSYTATVSDSASGSVSNAVTADVGDCNPCATANPLVELGTSKASDVGDGVGVQAGDTITYTLTSVVTGGTTTQDLVLTDVLGAGLDFGSVTAPGVFVVDTGGAPTLSFTLPAGTSAGTYSVSYTATVSDSASGSVSNAAEADVGDCSPCATSNPLVELRTSKASDVGSGVGVQTGDTITYTLTSVVTGGTTTQDLVLTDVLGAGLDFGSVTAPGAFVADTGGAPTLSFTLPAGTSAGTYSVSYTATVSDSASGSVSNAVTADVGDCSPCATANPLVELSTSKASDVGDGVGVQAGDTITYTLTSVVTGGTTTQDLILTDTLGAGLDFGSVTAPGSFVPDTGGAPTLSFTLPAGTSAGTYSVSYTATVSDRASGSVSNAVTANVRDCSPCATANPLVELSTSKASDVGDGVGVQAGDTITYTLTSVVTGGTTTQDLVLSDVLGAGLDFGSVTAPGTFVADTGGAPTLSFTLPAGTAAGTYSVSYTATVSDSASGSVSNAAEADVGDCSPCATANPLVELSTSKASDVGDGVGVQAGDTITYTLTSVVTGGTTTQDLVLTDVLGAGLDFGSVTAPGAFVADTGGAPTLSFTLPAGTSAGTYSVSYTATVSDSASGSVSNAVTADVGDCSPCATANPLVLLSTSKASDVGDGVGVQAGDTITYTLTSVVTGGTTTQDLVLTDVLGAGLDFGSVTAPGSFVPDTGGAPTLSFTLPAGTSAGTYSVSYTATVSDGASGSVSNAVTADVGNCNPCTTSNPLVELSTSKASDVGDGVGVQADDTITYTLTSVVTGGTTTQDLVLTDVLGTGLDFGSVTAAGAFVADTGGAPTLSFTLPAGTSAGTYSVSYTATVSDSASGSVSNAVTADVGGCSPCATANPLVELGTSKASDVGDGVGVQVGDTITYTLTSVVTGGTTTQDLVLTDTLGPGLDFGSVTAPGVFVAYTGGAPTLSFTLPAGTAAGTYSVSYSATVSDSASGSVSNAVTADVGDCSPCATANPLVELSTSKASDVGNGVGVQAGDTITYTLTSVVTGGTTTQDLVLTDTLGPGLDFGSVTDIGSFAADTGGAPELTFTLPSGTAAGTYSVSYTATVSDNASGPLSNAVVADVGECGSCATENPLVRLNTTKRSDVGDGANVQIGDTLTYTLTTVVAEGATTQDLILTDTLGTGLEFGNVTNSGPFTAETGAAPELSFTLPAGTPAGSHSISYTAVVAENAPVTLSNSVVASNGDCISCSTENHIPPDVRISKSLVSEDGAVPGLAELGETLIFEIVLTNTGSAADGFSVRDVLDTHLMFVDASDGGVHAGGIIDWTGLTVPQREGSVDGQLVLTVEASVAERLTETADTLVNLAKKPDAADPECPSEQCVVLPLQFPGLSLKKTGGFTDIDGDGLASTGDVLHYEYEVVNTGKIAVTGIRIEDEGPEFNGHAANGRLSDIRPQTHSLDVGETGHFSATYLLTQADIDNGAGLLEAVRNSAVARGSVVDGGGEEFQLASNESVFSFTLPAGGKILTISKMAERPTIRRGEQAPFTIVVANNSDVPVRGLKVEDQLPAGFRFIEGSALIDGAPAAPVVNGRSLLFDDISVEARSSVEIRLSMNAPASIGPGVYVNTAVLADPLGRRISAEAKASVQIEAEPVFDCGDVIGKVFDDRNRNGYPDDEEPGLPGVRLAVVEGKLITTDPAGRFHIPCAALPDQRLGTNFVIKLDARTLPSGYRLTTEHVRVVRLTAGKMTKVNFGASIQRVVRLDLRSDAFVRGTSALSQGWLSGIDQLIQILDREPSVLRLSYLDNEGSRTLARTRLAWVEKRIRKHWRRWGGRYRLDIETRVLTGKVRPPGYSGFELDAAAER